MNGLFACLRNVLAPLFSIKRALTLTLALMIPALPAFAQSGNITFVIPAPAGAGPDAIARTLSPQLGKKLNATIVVDNKPGASGDIGNETVAREKPDGSYYLVTSNNFAVTPAFRQQRFDPVNDFTPVTLLGEGKMVLVSSPALPVTSLPEAITYMRNNPGKLNYSSPGVGTILHLVAEVLHKRHNLDIAHIPNKSTVGALMDVMSGQTQFMIAPLQTALSYARANRLRILGVVGDERSPLAPEFASFGEQGVGGLNFDLSFWLAGPKNLDPKALSDMHKGISKLMQTPEIREPLAQQGIFAKTNRPEEQLEKIKNEIDYWKKFAAENNISIN